MPKIAAWLVDYRYNIFSVIMEFVGTLSNRYGDVKVDCPCIIIFYTNNKEHLLFYDLGEYSMSFGSIYNVAYGSFTFWHISGWQS